MDNNITEQDLHNLESVLNSWTDKPPSDSDLAAYFLDDKAIDALTNTSAPISFTASPQTSPLSSPLYNPPSSPSVSSLQGSSDSDEFEHEFFSTNLSGDGQLWNSCDITTENSFNFPTFNMDTQSNESAFKMTYLPPLPVTSIQNEDKKTQSDVSGKAPKKRRRQSEGKPSLNAKLSELNEEQLLLFDSNEIEQYIKNLSASRTISSSEEKNLKKIRRLIKNREYAQSSRNKKKAYVDELEAKLNLVEQEKSALQQRVNALEMENKTLKYHLARILKNSGRITSHVTSKTGLMSLFAIFFCFGLFAFGAYNLNSNVPSNTLTSDFQAFKADGVRTGRYVLSITEEGINQDSSFVKKWAPKFLQDMANGILGEKTQKLEKHYKPTVTITSLDDETTPMSSTRICDDTEITDKENENCIRKPLQKEL